MLSGQQESDDSIGISASHNGELGIQALSYCSKSPIHNLQQVEEVMVLKNDFDEIEIKKSSSFTFNFPKITILLALISKNLTLKAEGIKRINLTLYIIWTSSY